MTKNNLAIGEEVNLAEVLNRKLEAPILQSEIELADQATATKQAVRWDEFSVKHNNDGTLKGINQSDINLTSVAIGTGKAVRWNEWTKRHKDDGVLKPLNFNKTSVSNPSNTGDTFGTGVITNANANYSSLNILFGEIVFGGTFGTETVTATLEVQSMDGTAITITKTATAIGSATLTTADLMSLMKDDTYYHRVTVKSKSSIWSSAVTVTFKYAGTYL